MIDGEVLKRKGNAAAVAKALLFSEEGVLVRLVVGQLAYIVALGNVSAVDKVVK